MAKANSTPNQIKAKLGLRDVSDADAAKAFPEIAGFKVFRVPLSPGSLKERPDTH